MRPMFCRSPELPNILERAFAIARSGRCGGLTDIRLVLRRDGFSNRIIDDTMMGGGLRRDLKAAIKAARETN